VMSMQLEWYPELPADHDQVDDIDTGDADG
jgi:hypothetical protein